MRYIFWNLYNEKGCYEGWVQEHYDNWADARDAMDKFLEFTVLDCKSCLYNEIRKQMIEWRKAEYGEIKVFDKDKLFLNAFITSCPLVAPVVDAMSCWE